MCHCQLQVILATAKQEPRKSRPLWGKGDRASGGRGELAGYLDCPPTNAPIPTTTVQLTRTNHARPYNLASKFPLSEPSRAHLSPKVEAYLYAPLSATGDSSDCEAGAPKKPSPLGEGDRREPDGRGELAHNLRLPPNQRTHPNSNHANKTAPNPLLNNPLIWKWS